MSFWKRLLRVKREPKADKYYQRLKKAEIELAKEYADFSAVSWAHNVSVFFYKKEFNITCEDKKISQESIHNIYDKVLLAKCILCLDNLKHALSLKKKTFENLDKDQDEVISKADHILNSNFS